MTSTLPLLFTLSTILYLSTDNPPEVEVKWDTGVLLRTPLKMKRWWLSLNTSLGAASGSRTHTSVRTLGPEPSLSTSSSIAAFKLISNAKTTLLKTTLLHIDFTPNLLNPYKHINPPNGGLISI